MDFTILGALLELGIFGLLFGIGLAIASKKFAVEVDPRVVQIAEILPNANCGACGFPGCSGFAKAVVEGKVSVNGCPVGGVNVAEKIARILGVESPQPTDVMVAVAICNGGKRARDKFIYDGIAECRSALIVGNGQKMCSYGCLGFGTCVSACPFDALKMGSHDIPVTDFDRCTGCGICVRICPTKVMRLVPKNSSIYVACSSRDPGIFVRKVCEVGCIACSMCQRNCQYDAIKVVDNVAQIDYSRCTACGVCIEVCPTKCILNKFPEILEKNNGIPIPVPINPDETKKMLAEIKEKLSARKAQKPLANDTQTGSNGEMKSAG